MDNDDL
jgi:hypothetical protein